MNNCINCKYWNKEKALFNDLQYEKLGLAICDGVLELFDVTVWDESPEFEDLDYSVLKFKGSAKDKLAFVKDGSSYLAELWTKPDFGCLMFKSRS